MLATRTSQCSASISVRPPRQQCMQFYSTPLPTCEEEPSCNIHVFWWQLLITRKNPHLCLQILHDAVFQVFRGHTYYSRCWLSRTVRRHKGILDEIQQQPSVFVLSGPATVISNVATASAFLADGSSTESVSRVVRTAKTRQEKHEKEPAKHASYSHIHDEVTISDIFPATVQGLDGATQYQKMTRKMKQKSPYPTHCRLEDKFRGFMRTWSSHQIAHWYGCYVLVEQAQIHSGSRQAQFWCL